MHIPCTYQYIKHIPCHPPVCTWYIPGTYQYIPEYNMHPKDGRMPKTGRHKTGPDDVKVNLVFFSTFEELQLPIKGPMEDAGVVKLI